MNNPIQNQVTGAIAAVTSGNKFDMIEYLIPQRLEDGELINFKGKCIGTFEGEDTVFTEEGLEAPSRMTAKFIKEVTDPVAALLLGDDEPAEEQLDSEPSGDKEKKFKKKDVVLTDARKVEMLIEKGKFEKAKKALKKLDKDHPNYKQFKKTIKSGVKG